MSLDLFNLKGKTAIVTGASKGIGKGLAHALASAGANLVLVGRNERLLREVAYQIGKLGVKAIFIKTDISKEKEIIFAVEKSLKELSRVDILINCAGVMIRGAIEDITENDWDTLFSINLKGTFLFCKTVGKIMINQKKGKIINVSSISSVLGGENIPIYASSKGGVCRFKLLMQQFYENLMRR